MNLSTTIFRTSFAFKQYKKSLQSVFYTPFNALEIACALPFKIYNVHNNSLIYNTQKLFLNLLSNLIILFLYKILHLMRASLAILDMVSPSLRLSSLPSPEGRPPPPPTFHSSAVFLFKAKGRLVLGVRSIGNFR